MNRATREILPGGGLVLAVPPGPPGPPPLRFERVTGSRWVLRQGEQPLVQGDVEGDGCCRDLRLSRRPGYRSPLPPVTAAAMRRGPDWPHRYARWLEETAHGPLHRGRWRLTAHAVFPPGPWSTDLVREWPDTTLELLCGGGWHGVLPLRPLSAPDAPRVKAFRKHAREGTLAPVLLWWISFLDGWLIIDGHDRAAAALAEGICPPCMELVLVPDDTEWRATAETITAAHDERMARLSARPTGHHTPHQRRTLDGYYAEAIAALPYEAAETPLFDPAAHRGADGPHRSGC